MPKRTVQQINNDIYELKLDGDYSTDRFHQKLRNLREERDLVSLKELCETCNVPLICCTCL